MAPMGKLLTCLLRDSRLHNCEHFGQLQPVRAAETSNFSIAPMEKLMTRLALDSRLHNCKQRFGQIQSVRTAVSFTISHRPDGKIADVLALTLACAVQWL